MTRLFLLSFLILGCAGNIRPNGQQNIRTTTGDLTPASNQIDLNAICQQATIRQRLGNSGIDTPQGRFYCGTGI